MTDTSSARPASPFYGNEHRTEYPVAKPFMFNDPDRAQELRCAQGRHKQPLLRGQCTYCGEFDLED